MDRKLAGGDLAVALRDLPALPTSAATLRRVRTLIDQTDDGSSLDLASGELAEAIATDPALAARVLALAGGQAGDPPVDIRRAVEAIGAARVRLAALSTPVIDETVSELALPASAFREHCVAVASAAAMLAERTALDVPASQAYAGGLLHDIGKLVLQTCLPKSYARAVAAAEANEGDVTVYERRLVGVDHAVAGRRLAEAWGLGPCLHDVIWLTHQPFEALPQTIPPGRRVLVGLVGLADTLVRELGLGFSGNHTFGRTAEQQANLLGISADDLADVGRALAEHTKRLLAAAAMPTAVGPAGHLSEANAELGRLVESARRRLAPLSRRGAALATLGDVARNLHPRATVADTLTLVARLMTDLHEWPVTAAAPIVVYAGDGEEVLALRYDGSNDVRMRRLPGRTPAAGDPPNASAAAALEALLVRPDALADWLDPRACEHAALTSAEHWAGGLLVPREIAGAHWPIDPALRDVLGMAVAMVQARAAAMRLGEQLAGASQVLAATQDALAEAKTLAAVGAMAAGAAHELNTPLAVISGRAQWMREKATTEKDRDIWDTIAQQAQIVSDIVSALMEYASPPQPQPVPVAVGDLLAEAAGSGGSAKGAALAADIQVSADVPAVLVDRAQIVKALREVLANAAEASEGVPVSLTAERDDVDATVRLICRDAGTGMDPQTLQRACTPFFSRQHAGRRRGLGLPRARRFVEINGGRLWIRSRLGEGTTVTIQLPRAPT